MNRRQVSLGLGAATLALADGAISRAAETPQPINGFIGRFPFDWIEFNENGDLVRTQLPVLLKDPTITDFIIIAHGFRTTKQDARSLYLDVLEPVSDVLSSASSANRRFGILGVHWPSGKYEDPSDTKLRDTSLGSEDMELRQAIASYAEFVGLGSTESATLLARAQKVVEPSSSDAEFVALAQDMAQMQSQSATTQSDAELNAEGSINLLERIPDALNRLSDRASIPSRSAFVTNFASYFKFRGMKARAGDCGKTLAEKVLSRFPNHSGAPRVHLIGHSLGARLVAAAAYHSSSPTNSPTKIRSLILLQGAFSRYALSENHKNAAFPGAFRKVSGPTLVTYSTQDLVLELTYLPAMTFYGDSNRKWLLDNFAAIGATGASELAAADLVNLDPKAATEPGVFRPGKVHNMDCDGVITNHMNIKRNPHVTNFVAAALRF